MSPSRREPFTTSVALARSERVFLATVDVILSPLSRAVNCNVMEKIFLWSRLRPQLRLYVCVCVCV